MINVAVNSSIALFNTASGTVLNPDASKTILTDLFLDLSTDYPQLIPVHDYVVADRNCIVGIAGIADKTHLMPTFNMMSVPSLQCEFTSRLQAKQIGFLELDKRHEHVVREYYAATDFDLRNMLHFATLEIGSIGCRSTNRDMAFELRIEYIPTDQILAALDGIVTIVNKDKRNRLRSFGYVLTCRSEVEQLIESLGLDDTYLKAIEAVEAFQKRQTLAAEYDGERVADYKAKTMKKTVRLAA